MAKRYLYNGETFQSEYAVRQAIWKSEHRIFGDFDAELWGVTVEEYEPEASIPVDLTDEEVAERMRLKRDKLLEASDFYMMIDYPSTEEGLIEVKTYRQALRDITAQSGFPNEIKWPALPSVLGGQ